MFVEDSKGHPIKTREDLNEEVDLVDEKKRSKALIFQIENFKK